MEGVVFWLTAVSLSEVNFEACRCWDILRSVLLAVVCGTARLIEGVIDPSSHDEGGGFKPFFSRTLEDAAWTTHGV